MPVAKSLLEEQLRKGERLSVGWPWRLLTFMGVALGMVVLAYAGMTLGYKTYLNARVRNLDARIEELNKSLEEGKEKNLTNTYSQLVNIQTLLASHPMPSKLFEILEKNTHPRAYYNNFNLAVPEKILKIEGIAPDYKSVTEQMELYRRIPEVRSVFLDDSSLKEDGSVRFGVRLLIKPEIFK